MNTVISKFDVRLVKEKDTKYDLHNEIIKNPNNAADLFDKVLEMQCRMQEVFAICTVDIKNQVTGIFEVTTGGLSSSIVHPREVFQRAILQGAAAIILCHNHPSGIPEPSRDDINITKKLINAGNIIGIDVLDHIIIGENRHLSMKEKGYI